MKRTKQSTFAKRERSEKSTGFAPVGGEDMTQPAKHTPGPPCTCQVRHHRHDTGIGVMEETDINMCPLHAAAPAMYEALLLVLDDFGGDYKGPTIDAVRAALAQVDGKQ